jgi:hypothetical protein
VAEVSQRGVAEGESDGNRTEQALVIAIPVSLFLYIRTPASKFAC